jgi:hypothetical protein
MANEVQQYQMHGLLQGAVLAAQSAEARAATQAEEAQHRLQQASLKDAKNAQVSSAYYCLEYYKWPCGYDSPSFSLCN